MIKIIKGVEPKILNVNKAAWTKRLLNHIDRGEDIPKSLSSAYNHFEVKEALKIESRQKCMYCESTVAHVAHEHIEHIKPKAKDKFPELTFEWQNLGLACPICNMNKGADYDKTLPFINPYIDNPDQFFIALGSIIYNRPANPRAELTKRKIQLNRPELIEKRKERLEAINRLIDRYHEQTNPALKQAILDEIKIEIDDDKPYSFCARSLYNALI